MPSARQPRKPTRVSDEDLSPGIRRLLDRIRKEVEPGGWIVHVDKRGEDRSFLFTKPLSPVHTGWHFDPRRPKSELKKELDEYIAAQAEFGRTKKATPPHNKRRLLGGIRWAATSYGWSPRVFEELIETLHQFRVLSNDEWSWLRTVGPDVLPKDLEREWRKRVTMAKQRERRTKPPG